MKALIFVLFAVALSVNFRDPKFASYIKKYGKKYSGPEEMRYRLDVYHTNVKKIAEHNAKHLPWTMTVNKFADISEEEFLYKFCGCANDPKTSAEHVTRIYGDAPEHVDWREKGAITPVKEQASCGSCWSFSATGTVESAYFIKTGKLVSLSEQQLVDCAKKPKYDSSGCRGGWPRVALDYVSDYGLCTEEDYPYHAADEDCKESQCKVAVQTKGKVQLPRYDEVSLANAVALNPVSIVLDAGTMQFYEKGIITECGVFINHAVLAVGYGVDEETGIKYWIMKNCWGENWGDKGYCKVEKDINDGSLGRCGLTFNPVYPTF